MRNIKFRTFALLTALLILAGTREARADLMAGAAKRDVTPDVAGRAIPLGGYAARRGAAATGVHDPVFARAIVLADGGAKIGLVSVDLCFLPANVKAQIVERVAAAGVVGLDAAHLFVSATHTHTAPDPLAMHTGNTFPELKNWTHFDPALLDFTAARIADAVIAADKAQIPARAGSRTVSLSKRRLNRNRRGDKTLDSELTALKITTRDGRPLAALFDFAAHPTLYDAPMLDISADWPGAATAAVERELGGGAVCLFLNGDEGDASPNGATGQTESERVANYGETVARAVLDVMRPLRTKDRLPIAAWTQKIILPTRRPNPLFLIAAGQFGATYPQTIALVNGLMPTETVLSFAQIGSLLLMGFPCEPTGEIGSAAKALARRAGQKHPALVALTNDWLAYCVTAAQYRAGKYESSMSFYGPELGAAMLDAVRIGLSANDRRGNALSSVRRNRGLKRLRAFGLPG